MTVPEFLTFTTELIKLTDLMMDHRHWNHKQNPDPDPDPGYKLLSQLEERVNKTVMMMTMMVVVAVVLLLMMMMTQMCFRLVWRGRRPGGLG